MGEPAQVISLGIDQAKRSGWGIASGRTVVRWGVVDEDPDALEAVVALAKELNGGTLRGVLVAMEDHSRMHRNRLTAQDKRTVRGVGESWVQRNPEATLIGLGDARGRWRHVLEREGHPKPQRLQVDPLAWRRTLGINGPQAKVIACRVAETACGLKPFSLEDFDLAEGVCLTLWAASQGRMRDELRRRSQRASAKGRRQVAAQMRLMETDHGTSAESSGRNDGRADGGGDPFG